MDYCLCHIVTRAESSVSEIFQFFFFVHFFYSFLFLLLIYFYINIFLLHQFAICTELQTHTRCLLSERFFFRASRWLRILCSVSRLLCFLFPFFFGDILSVYTLCTSAQQSDQTNVMILMRIIKFCGFLMCCYFVSFVYCTRVSAIHKHTQYCFPANGILL